MGVDWNEISPAVFWGFLFPALGGFMFGYDIGATSHAITDDQVLLDYHAIGEPVLAGVLHGASLYGALIMSVILFNYGDSIGRKRTMIMSSALYFMGSLFSAMVPGEEKLGLTFLVLSRMVYGCGIGSAMHSVPVYIAEMAPPSVRGFLISLKEAVIVFGMFMGYVVGGAFMSQTHGWRYMYGMGCVGALVYGGGVFYLPDSPRWLLLKNLKSPYQYPRDLARDALMWFRGDLEGTAIDVEIADIVDSLQAKNVPPELVGLAPSRQAENTPLVSSFEEEEKTDWAALFKSRRALVIGNGLLLFQQITGQPSVLYYAVTIFRSANFGKSSAAFASLGVAFVKLITTLYVGFKVDQYGRRLLLTIGISGMGLALSLIALAFQYGFTSTVDTDDPEDEGHLSKAYSGLALFGFMLLVASYQVGYGPISWMMVSEVYPLKLRSMALSVGTIVNFGSNIAVTSLFPVLIGRFGQGPVFWMFAFITACSLVFVFYYVPETKGKSLEQIEAMLKADDYNPRGGGGGGRDFGDRADFVTPAASMPRFGDARIVR